MTSRKTRSTYTVEFDELVRSPSFQCGAAAGSAPSASGGGGSFDFRELVVGVLGNGHLMDRIYATWLPELGRRGNVYLMADACGHANISLAMFLRCRAGLTPDSTCAEGGQRPRTAPMVRLECFAPPRDCVPLTTPFGAAGVSWLGLPHLNRTNTLWVKTAAFLRGMWAAFPRRRWYVKADEDTLLLPRSLGRLLAACDAALAPSAPVYLGNVATTRQLDLSPAAAAAGLGVPSLATAPPGGVVSGAVSAVRYANGGAGYALNQRAMRLVAGMGGGAGLLAAAALYFGNYSLFGDSALPQPAEGVVPLGEDAAVWVAGVACNGS